MFAADALGPAPASQSVAPPLYLALGDSLAAGMQPDTNGHDRPTKQGYVDVVARSLARSHPGLQSQTLSCGGATAGTLLHGGAGCQPNGERGQLERAEDILGSHPEAVLVTVNIGDNDIEVCIDDNTGSVDTACLKRGEARIRQALPEIAKRLRAAAPPSATVIGLVDYDQFLSLWLQGAKGRAAARRSLPIIRRLNQLAASIYRPGRRQGRRCHIALRHRGPLAPPRAAWPRLRAARRLQHLHAHLGLQPRADRARRPRPALRLLPARPVDPRRAAHTQLNQTFMRCSCAAR